MINRYMKKLATTLVVSSLLFTQISFLNTTSFADYTVLTTTNSSENISTGVSYNEKLMFTDIGWISVKYMYIDLQDKNTYVDVLYNKDDITVRNKLSKLSTSSQLVGSINGDFFDYGAKSTLGTIVSEGNFISTGIHDGKFASFNISKLGIPFLENWSSAGLNLTSDTAKLDIEYKNKPYLDFDRAIVYDYNWKEKSYGNTLEKDIVEIVIKDGFIQEIRRNLDPVTIDSSTTVISAIGTKISYIMNNFKVGDSVNINYDINFNNIKTSVGGGSIILDNGEVVKDLTLPVLGRHPRTSVGINKERNKLIYAIVEGRTSSYTGITESELAKIMRDLGAYSALNLDGGGSTEMIKKTLGTGESKIVNNPTDGVERAIFTGLGVFNNSKKGTIENLNIDMDKVVLLNTQINFKAFNIDENYFKSNVNFDDLSIVYKENEFKVDKTSITPLKEGTYELEFKLNNSSVKKSVTVKDAIVDLAINKSAFIVDVNTQTNLDIKAIDENGFRYNISPDKLNFKLSSDKLGRIDENYNFVSSSNITSGYMCISYKNIKKYVPIIIGDNYKTITDFEPNKDIVNSLTFSSYPEANKGSLKIHEFGINNTYGALLEYDFSYSTKTRAAYISLGEKGYLLDDSSQKLGLNVFGNYGNSHWLRAKLTDGDGKSHNIDFANSVNWEGWKYVEASIPSQLKRPLTLSKIYLVEDEKSKTDNGVISLDHLVQIGTSSIKVDLPADVTGVSNITKNKLDAKADYKLNIFTNTRDSYKNFDKSVNILLANADSKNNASFNLTSKPNKYVNNKVGNLRIMNFVNYNNSIRKSGYGQWLDLLKLEDGMDANGLVLILSSGKSFKDKLEEKLFYDTISNIEQKYGISAVVIYPNDTNISEKINSIDVIGVQTKKLKSKDFLNKYLSVGFKNTNLSYQLND